MRTAIILILTAIPLWAADPRTTSWIRGTAPLTEALQKIALDVHDVRWNDDAVTVESAGLSLRSFGILQAGPFDAQQAVRHFTYRIPRDPKPALKPVPTPLGVVGAFVNGVPIYNSAAVLSYRNANLWHADIVSFLDDGTRTAQGWLRSGQERTPTAPLLQALLAQSDRHSPLIGFALDGYPIYGPYGWDGAGQVRRFCSSYAVRRKLDRSRLPTGSLLTPEQEGPTVDSDFPAGTFVEDYEYVAGSGDLDEHNGRFAVTPEFPEGTYAYFLATTETGKLAYPYLIGPTFRGEYAPLDLTGYREHSISKGLRLLTKGPGEFVFQSEYPVLEQVHERQMHVVVVSQDLAFFDHVHPEPLAGGLYRLDYKFPQAGKYWVFSDHTPPGQPQTISRFAVVADGPAVFHEPPNNESAQEVTVSGVTASLSTNGPLRTGQDVRLQFHVGVTDLEPYLGSWGHIMIASWDRTDFIHAHPVEGPSPLASPGDFWSHSHGTPGPSPDLIETVTGFNRPGIYKIWLQVQLQGQVLTFPWVVRVSEGKPAVSQSSLIPKGAVLVTVSAAGYSPARIEILADTATTLAFRRTDAQNCAGKVVFPELGISKDLPVGETVLVPLAARKAGTLHFACGMGMFKGSVVVR